MVFNKNPSLYDENHEILLVEFFTCADPVADVFCVVPCLCDILFIQRGGVVVRT